MKSEYESQNLTEKIVPETEPITLPKTCSERIVDNPHFAGHLRTRLLRRASPAAREIISQMSDTELVETYLRNEQQGRTHVAKRRTGLQALTGYKVVSE
jgi:hypothetical protein